MKTIALFASHNGSLLDTLYEACAQAQLQAKLACVISNNSDAKVLEKAKEYNIDAHIINQARYDDVSNTLDATLQRYGCDTVVLSGYMKKLSPRITRKYRVVNTHPSLLPQYGGKGMYGRHVHHAVLENAEAYSGATVHLVNEEYDKGKILLQSKVSIDENETVYSLEAKVKKEEKKIILEALKRLD